MLKNSLIMCVQPSSKAVIMVTPLWTSVMYYSNSTIEAHVIIIILSTVFVKMFVCIQSCVLNYNLMYFFHQLLFWILYNIVMRHIFDPRVLSSYSFFKILQVANYFGSLSHPTQKACTDQILTLQT